MRKMIDALQGKTLEEYVQFILDTVKGDGTR
jgi:hypothetical protein